MHLELVILGLLVAIAALAALAGRLRVPAPILLVAGGLCLGWVRDAGGSTSRKPASTSDRAPRRADAPHRFR